MRNNAELRAARDIVSSDFPTFLPSSSPPQYLHLLLVLGQHADVLLLLVVFLFHDCTLALVQGNVLPWKNAKEIDALK